MTSQGAATTMTAAGRPEAGAQAVLRAENLRKEYRSGAGVGVVLAGVDLRVSEGELVAIVGPSGAGKSTLLHLLAALDTPTSGRVYFRGKSLETLANMELADFRNRRVGFVWQRHHLLADFSAGENVAMPLMLRGMRREEAIEQAKHWLAEVGLAGREAQPAGELSGGEQQRVAIARALVGAPAVLLADEPTGDLDEQNAEAVFSLFQRVHRSHRLTSVMATHNLSLARRADRVLELSHGTLRPAASAVRDLG